MVAVIPMTKFWKPLEFWSKLLQVTAVTSQDLALIAEACVHIPDQIARRRC